MGTEAPKTKQFTEEIHSYFSSSAFEFIQLENDNFVQTHAPEHE